MASAAFNWIESPNFRWFSYTILNCLHLGEDETKRYFCRSIHCWPSPVYECVPSYACPSGSRRGTEVRHLLVSKTLPFVSTATLRELRWMGDWFMLVLVKQSPLREARLTKFPSQTRIYNAQAFQRSRQPPVMLACVHLRNFNLFVDG